MNCEIYHCRLKCIRDAFNTFAEVLDRPVYYSTLSHTIEVSIDENMTIHAKCRPCREDYYYDVELGVTLRGSAKLDDAMQLIGYLRYRIWENVKNFYSAAYTMEGGE